MADNRSKLFEYATAFYGELEKSATTEKFNSKDFLVFRGSIVRAYRSLGISQAHYSNIRQGLLDTNCISILQQGARDKQSIIVLHHPPVESELKLVTGERSRLTDGADLATLAQDVRDMKERLGGLSVIDAFANMEQRLQQLETAVKQLQVKSPLITNKGDR